jgi:hypothetical protein
MKTIEQAVMLRTYQSDVRDGVRTTEPALARVIAWADNRPTVWRIVTGHHSKAFGLGSCEYIGWAQRSTASEAILERARHFMELIEQPGQWSHANSIFTWRAKFTLEHYLDRGFTSGFFQQHDANFPRSCLTLDYTPETFEEVLDKFCAWMDSYYETVRVTVDNRTVRTFHEGRVHPCSPTGA